MLSTEASPVQCRTATPAEKVRARKALNHAVAAGDVIPQPCETCTAPKAQGHHDDYSKPLAVRWLCAGCHSKLHNQKHPLTKECAQCGQTFTPHKTKRARQVTCSRHCFSRHAHRVHSRLTIQQMVAMKLRYDAGGITQLELANEYGCDRTRVGQIVRGKASRLPDVNLATYSGGAGPVAAALMLAQGEAA